MNLACQGKENKKEGESISDTYVKNAEMKSYKTIFHFYLPIISFVTCFLLIYAHQVFCPDQLKCETSIIW